MRASVPLIISLECGCIRGTKGVKSKFCILLL